MLHPVPFIYQYLFLQVKTDVGIVDILVNNAGIVTGKKFLDCSDELMQKTMDVNATAHFWVNMLCCLLKLLCWWRIWCYFVVKYLV